MNDEASRGIPTEDRNGERDDVRGDPAPAAEAIRGLVVKPPENPAEMSDAELEAWAAGVIDELR